jgi:hypothetical protein
MNLHTMYKAGMITPSTSMEADEVQEGGFPRKGNVQNNHSGNTKSTTGTTTSNNTYTAAIQTTAATVAAASVLSAVENDEPNVSNQGSPGKPPMAPAIRVKRKKSTAPRELTQADYDEDGLDERERAEEERRRRRKKPPLLESPFEELVIDHSKQEDDDVSFITMPKAIRDDKDVTGRRIPKDNINLDRYIQKGKARTAPSISSSMETDNMANLMKLKVPPVNNPMVAVTDDDDDDGDQDINLTSPAQPALYLGTPSHNSLLSDHQDHETQEEVVMDPYWEGGMKRDDDEKVVGVHPQDRSSAPISPSAAAPPQRVTSVEEEDIRNVKKQMEGVAVEDIRVVLPMHAEEDHEDMSSISQSHTHKRTLSTDSPPIPPFAPRSQEDAEYPSQQPPARRVDPPTGVDEEEKPTESNVQKEPIESNAEDEPTESHRDKDDPRPPASKKKKRKKKKKLQEGDGPKKKKKKKKRNASVKDGETDSSAPKKTKKKKKKIPPDLKKRERDDAEISKDPPSTPKPANKPVSESTAATSEDVASRTATSSRLLAPFSWKGGRKRRSNPPNHVTMAGFSSNDRILEENHSISDDDAIVNAMAQSTSMGASVDGNGSIKSSRKRIFRFGKKKRHTTGMDVSTDSGSVTVQKSDHRSKQRKWYTPMKLKASQLSFKRRKHKPADDAFQEMTSAATGSATGVRSTSSMQNADMAAVCASSRGDGTNKADIDFYGDANDASSTP